MKIALIAVVALTLLLGGLAFGLALQQQSSRSTPDLSTATKTQEQEQERPPGIEERSWKPLSPECGLVIDKMGPEGTYKGRLMARIAGRWVEVYLAPGPAELVQVR
jgi:hypothetical protein